ncbi:MAG TPA: HlyD family secretion protein [Victivallales bacterium]|nr:HlyD family secretion protein [Victivallales bacterium]
MNKRKKITIIFFSVIIAVIGIYFVFHGWVFAYTSDAYIRAHMVVVTPRVKGHIQNIYVKDNQYVKKGTLLMQLDPYPYQLMLNVKKSSLRQEKSQLKILYTRYELAQKKLKFIANEYNVALLNFERYKKLSVTGAVSKQSYEEKISELDDARNKLTEGKEQCQYWEEMINSQEISIDSIKSQVAMAEYRLEQAQIYAPADGYITNFNVRPGDYAGEGEPMFVLIQDGYWWVMSNYKESVIRHIKPEQKVYIYTDMHPFRLFKGTVEFIGRGTSRTKDKTKLLPYIEPTTDWIRLQRRFSVRIKFDNLPKDIKFAEGANARTFIVL